MITEERVTTNDKVTPDMHNLHQDGTNAPEDAANGLIPYGSEPCLKPHCKWCASQGLGQDDDDIFDQHFKTIVSAMRRHEGKIAHTGGTGVNYRNEERGSVMSDRMDLEEGDEVNLGGFSLASWTRWGAAQSVLALVVVAIIGGNFLGSSPLDKATFAGLTKKTFSTSTGSIKVKFEGDTAIVTGIGTQAKQPALRWHGGWQDEVALLEGRFDRANWLKVEKEQLTTADGLILYNSKAPEIATVNNMRTFRDRVFKYYQAFGHYPVTSSDLCQDDSYVNAVSDERQPYDIKQVINGAIVNADAPASVSDSRSSAIASRSGAKEPGAIWGVGVKSDPIIAADNNSYNFHNNSFYIYGADSKGQPVKGGVVGKDFTIALKNGADVSELQTASLDPNNAKVALFVGNKPEATNIRWRYSLLGFALFLLSLTTAMRCLHARSGDEQLTRLRKGRKA